MESTTDTFLQFCKKLEMSKATVDSIRYRYRQITKRINLEYRNSDSETNYSLYVGSYGRNTEIFTSDIDIIVILPYETYKRINGYTGNKQSSLLSEVRTALKKTYSTSYVKADGQVIGINFVDGINFEIVPVFLNTDESYTYPDTNNGGSWRETNPKLEISAMTQRNNEVNGNLKQLCRMIRAWKTTCNVNMSGYLIDTLAYNFIINWKYKDKSYLYYDYLTRDFFKYLKDLDPQKEYWLAPGSNKRVYKNGNFQFKANQAYQNALQAIEAHDKKCYYTEKEAWRKIYGNKIG